jgi:pimeloyl-ACP methyl ester carboxylesterase
MLPSKNQLRQPYQHHDDEGDDDSDDDDDDQRIDGSAMRYPVAGTAHHNPNHPTSFAQPPSNQQPQHQQPPLGLTGVLCDSHRLIIPNRGSLHYTIFRPRQIGPQHKPPVVCVPGGPVLPSNYLQSIVYTVTDRSVILYDPIGCGQSPSVLDTSVSSSTVSSLTLTVSSASATTDTDTNTNTNMTTNVVVQEQVSDLKYLLDHLPCQTFHLLGHSFGGILVYEYLKLEAVAEAEHEDEVEQQTASVEKETEVEEELSTEVDSPLDTATTKSTTKSKSTKSASARSPKKKECCSVILASTPVSIPSCQADCDRLLADISKELALKHNNHGNDDGGNYDDNDSDDNAEDERYMRQQQQLEQLDSQQQWQPSKQAQDMFWQRHECRVTPMPYALQQALQQSSVQSTAGHGLIRLQHEAQQPQAPNNNDNGGGGLSDYVATAPTVDGSRKYIMPPALVLRGQYDFVLASNSLDVWGDLLLNGDDGEGNGNTEYITLAGTSHYAMVEQEDLFGSVMQVFFQKHDPARLEVPAFLRPGAPTSRQHSSQQRKHKHRHQYLDPSGHR